MVEIVKWDRTKFFKLGDSRVVRVPASIFKDDAYPFSRDETDFVMAIETDGKGRRGLFIREDEHEE